MSSGTAVLYYEPPGMALIWQHVIQTISRQDPLIDSMLVSSAVVDMAFTQFPAEGLHVLRAEKLISTHWELRGGDLINLTRFGASCLTNGSSHRPSGSRIVWHRKETNKQIFYLKISGLHLMSTPLITWSRSCFQQYLITCLEIRFPQTLLLLPYFLAPQLWHSSESLSPLPNTGTQKRRSSAIINCQSNTAFN